MSFAWIEAATQEQEAERERLRNERADELMKAFEHIKDTRVIKGRKN